MAMQVSPQRGVVHDTNPTFTERHAMRSSKIIVNFRLSAKMKKTVAMLLSILSVLLLAVSADAKQVRVKGYYRKNGTYVSPHVRNVGGGSKSSHRSYSAPSRGTHSYHIPSYSTPSRGTPSYNTPSDSTPFDSKSSAEKTSFDTPLDSLPRCQAVNEDGSSCKRPANPGLRYCYRHVGNSDAPKNEFEENLKAKTLQWMTDIDDAIKRYIGPSKRPPPESLKELQTQMGAIVSRLKDAWGASFHYETDGIGYTIASNGPDGKFGTDDDIAIVQKGTELTKPNVENATIEKLVQEVISGKESNGTTEAVLGVKNELENASTSNLSLVEIPFSKDNFRPRSSGAHQPRIVCRTKSVFLATCSFVGLLVLAFLGFALLSSCSLANKITRTLLSIPGILAVSLLAYWYVPVQEQMTATQKRNGEHSEGIKGWTWSSMPGSRFLFVNSNEKINGDCAQLVLNGKGMPYAGIAFPSWLNVQRKATIPAAVRFDDHDPLEDPWIRAKGGTGIFAPWPMKDFIEAAEASHRFGITFEDKDKKLYTFTFNIDNLKPNFGLNRKCFMGGK